MPPRIDAIFSELRTRKAKALMPFVCGVHPGPGDTAKVLPALERAGASIVEIGFPFSDPIADGPVIAAAMHEALLKGATPSGVLDEVRSVRSKLNSGIGLGLVAMVSLSIVWRFGPAKLIEAAKAAGIDGFILPDLIIHESDELLGMVRDAGLSASLLVAPTTPPERAAQIAKACSGFVYLLARAGITGETGSLPDVSANVRMLRSVTDLPIACGFGISSAEHVRHVVHAGGADAAIVGSALVRRMGQAAIDGHDPIASAETFTRDLARGLSPSTR